MKTFLLLLSLLMFASCDKPNLFGFPPKEFTVDVAVMHQLNEGGNVIQNTDEEVTGYVVSYTINGDTLNTNIRSPNDSVSLYWNGVYKDTKLNEFCDQCKSYTFLTNTGNNLIFHIKGKEIIAMEIKSTRNAEKVLFLKK